MTAPDIRARRIGRERLPIAVIDHFAPDPEALRAFALGQAFEPARNHYPGVRAPLPKDYLRAQAGVLGLVLDQVFGVTGATARVLDASFAMVCTPRDALSREQRLPHVDATAADRIALVHYLSPDPAGTAFFRHRATGFESVDVERSGSYLAASTSELAGDVPATDYVHSDTLTFERLHTVEAAFNRAVIYRGHALHSGAIAHDTPLSADPATGRLTVTAFLATG